MSARSTTHATAVLHGGPLDGGEKSLATQTGDRRGRRQVQKELAIVEGGLVHVYLLTQASPSECATLQRYHYTHKCTFKPFAASG